MPKSSGEKLWDAVDASKRIKMEQLLDEPGIDVNWFPISGHTPLHRAVFRGNVKVARALLDKGADVNKSAEATDGNVGGETPLHMAVIAEAATKRLELVQLLLDAGADQSLGDGKGMTPGQLAVDSGERLCLRLLEVPSSEPSPPASNSSSSISGGPFCPQWRQFPTCQCEGRVHQAK